MYNIFAICLLYTYLPYRYHLIESHSILSSDVHIEYKFTPSEQQQIDGLIRKAFIQYSLQKYQSSEVLYKQLLVYINETISENTLNAGIHCDTAMILSHSVHIKVKDLLIKCLERQNKHDEISKLRSDMQEDEMW